MYDKNELKQNKYIMFYLLKEVITDKFNNRKFFSRLNHYILSDKNSLISGS